MYTNLFTPYFGVINLYIECVYELFWFVDFNWWYTINNYTWCKNKLSMNIVSDFITLI